MITEKLNRSRVQGFLHADGKKLVNGKGEEILLAGWGLGNWLLTEGYMWLAFFPQMDRPSRIEKVIRDLTGEEYAKQFWKKYRENYIQREDIMEIARQGYNSVRIPFSWKIFLEDREEIVWKKEGFEILDKCLSWCEEAGIYAFLDMHGAPGGQTGSNIDDSPADKPELFLNESYKEKAIALWKKLAERYGNREIVGGYDLLNEPIIPVSAGNGDFEYLLPNLREFYEDCIKAIREVDKNHLLSIEGHNWATKTDIFSKKYDDNMVLHFHRYATLPDTESLKPYMRVADKLQIPLWLGETGENKNTWYAAMYPLCLSLGIGYNLWPWKKMECSNSPFSIYKPEGWEEVLAYAGEGKKLTKSRAIEILDCFLDNIRIENCKRNDAVTRHVFRSAPCNIRATDFDEPIEGKKEYYVIKKETKDNYYRKESGKKLQELCGPKEPEFTFDCGWDRFGLVLTGGESASYRFCFLHSQTDLYITAKVDKPTILRILQDDEELVQIPMIVISVMKEYKVAVLHRSPETVVKIEVLEGSVCLETIKIQ